MHWYICMCVRYMCFVCNVLLYDSSEGVTWEVSIGMYY